MDSIFETARRGLPFDDVTIIDVHGHMGELLQTYLPFNSPDELADNLRRIGVNRACYCGAPYGGYGDQSYWNKKFAEAVSSHSDVMSGYVTLCANFREEALEEYLRGEQAGLTLGLKLHSLRQPFSVTEKFLYPVYERLNERRAWCMHHYFGPEHELEQLLKDFPNVTFIQGHPVVAYANLAKKYPNLYMCTCAGIRFGMIKTLVDLFGADRVLMGSDSICFDLTYGIGPVAFAPLCEEDKRKILGENALRLYERILPVK